MVSTMRSVAVQHYIISFYFIVLLPFYCENTRSFWLCFVLFFVTLFLHLVALLLFLMALFCTCLLVIL